MEIDVCATAGKTFIVGEAKWKTKTIKRSDIETLIKKMHHIKEKLTKQNSIGIIITRGKITEDARNLEGKNIILLDLNELDDILNKLCNETIK